MSKPMLHHVEWAMFTQGTCIKHGTSKNFFTKFENFLCRLYDKGVTGVFHPEEFLTSPPAPENLILERLGFHKKA